MIPCAHHIPRFADPCGAMWNMYECEENGCNVGMHRCVSVSDEKRCQCSCGAVMPPPKTVAEMRAAWKKGGLFRL